MSSVHRAVGGVLKNGSDRTYLLRAAANPGVVTGEPTACNNIDVSSLAVCQRSKHARGLILHLARVLAHLLDVNPAKNQVSKDAQKSCSAEYEPAMNEF